ncbi:TRAP transporter large permease [Ruicaihuangia caeni]|uniref:TRAP transporter large permease n=1 Tax=Ruicaihuangia caeni TaxID=3042517 RepID=UPI00339000BE
MSPETITIALVALGILLIFILAEQPIWIGLAASGALGLVLLNGIDVASNTIGLAPFTSTAVYTLVIIPLFVAMGVFAARAGIADDIFIIAERVSRRIPGNLGVATILACGGFAAVTGSSVATAATFGRVAVSRMAARGYRPDAAAALVAMGGTLGVLIPPSVVLVVYASLTGSSIGKLLLAAVLPGLTTMAVYIIFVIVLYKRGFFDPQRLSKKVAAAERRAVAVGATVGAGGTGVTTATLDAPLRNAVRPEKPVVTRKNIVGAFYVALLFAIVIGGMYLGWFTATEAGAIAAFVALIIVVVRLSRGGFKATLVGLKDSIIESASLGTMIFALLAGGGIFSFFLLKTGIPSVLARQVVDWGLPAWAIVVIALIVMVILGMFLDGFSIMIIVIPLLWPVLDAVGVDAIWFGILTVKAVEIGLVTPPFGLNVYVVSSAAPGVKPEKVFAAVMPFVLAEFVVIALLMLFPQIVSFLPSLAAI